MGPRAYIATADIEIPADADQRQPATARPAGTWPAGTP